jgi:hypothetical protein
MSKFIIASRSSATEGYSVSSSPKIHTDKYVAETEAIRLASLTPGKQYVVIQLISAHQVQKVNQVPV